MSHSIVTTIVCLILASSPMVALSAEPVEFVVWSDTAGFVPPKKPA